MLIECFHWQNETLVNEIQDMSRKIINRGGLNKVCRQPSCLSHPKVVAARAAHAIGAHEALFNFLTCLLLNFLEVTHVKF